MTSNQETIKIKQNKLYSLVNPSLKIAMHVLEQGISIKDGKIDYDDTKGMSWLSKMAHDLKGEVSRATIDEHLDSLLDERFLKHGDQEMTRVKDGEVTKWVRGYYLGNEFLQQIKDMYSTTHIIPGDFSSATK